MAQLILVRHGESEWNRDHRFTGWADIGLTGTGREQMREVGTRLRDANVQIDVAFTSMLSRCILSQWILLENLGRVWIPTVADWRLNERHYGALTGLSKAAAIATFGDAAVERWRRSFDVPPPAGSGEGAGYVTRDARYAHLLPGEYPQGEALTQVVDRIRLVWENVIGNALRSGQNVLVTGHGNSLRALIKLVENIADDQIAHVEVPNAAPTIYTFDAGMLVIDKHCIYAPAQPQSEIL